MKKYIVDLDEHERNELEQLTTKGRSGARKIRRARILLLADEGRIDKEIASFLGSAVTTVERVRKRFVEEGLEAALRPKPSRRAYRGKLDGEQEAKLIALACSSPPEGKKRWTLRLLAARMAELEIVPEASHETVRQVLGKKRAPAASAADVVHPAPAVGRVRLAHGGRARGLLPPRRPEAAGGLPRRAEHPADRRGAGPLAAASRAGRAL